MTCHHRHAAGVSTLRVSALLILYVRAGRPCLSERAGRHRPRAGRQDADDAFAAVAVACQRARCPGAGWRCWWAWRLSMLHGYACVSHRGDQAVLGMAITMTAAGLTVVLGIAWFQQGGQTPPLSDAVRIGACSPCGRRRRPRCR